MDNLLFVQEIIMVVIGICFAILILTITIGVVITAIRLLFPTKEDKDE